MFWQIICIMLFMPIKQLNNNCVCMSDSAPKYIVYVQQHLQQTHSLYSRHSETLKTLDFELLVSKLMQCHYSHTKHFLTTQRLWISFNCQWLMVLWIQWFLPKSSFHPHTVRGRSYRIMFCNCNVLISFVLLCK